MKKFIHLVNNFLKNQKNIKNNNLENNNLFNKKILLIQNQNLINGQGGVEHVLCNMANVCNEVGMNVIVATMDKKKGKPFYHLDKNVSFYNLYNKINIFKIFRLKLIKKSKWFKKELKYKNKIWNGFIKEQKPNIIVCFSLPTLLELTYIKKFNVPIILTVHGNPINDYTNRFWPRSDEMNKLYEDTYTKCDVIQVLLDSYKQFVPDSFNGEVVTIPNIAPYTNFTIDYNHQEKLKRIVCIASLNERKHQDLLINAFARISNNHPDWMVEIWGSGEKEKEYQYLINNLKMNDKIFLKGVTKEPQKVLSKTDIFVLPSTCEGWPLVLGEAMSMGIPSVGLLNCDGTNEIIKHEQNGLLCEDSIEDLSIKLEFLINNKNIRQYLGLNAQKDMTNNTEDIIWEKWKELIATQIKY